jgi:hypothetical protein
MSNFPLRLSKDLMEDARSLAKDQGVSINQFVANVLAQRIGEMKMMAQFSRRARLGDPLAALAALSRTPSITPLAGDELPLVANGNET